MDESHEDLRYSMLIEWSDEDQAFLVMLPEWSGKVNEPTTHGSTYEDAVRNGQEALADLADMWREKGWALPAPRIHAAAGA